MQHLLVSELLPFALKRAPKFLVGVETMSSTVVMVVAMYTSVGGGLFELPSPWMSSDKTLGVKVLMCP